MKDNECITSQAKPPTLTNWGSNISSKQKVTVPALFGKCSKLLFILVILNVITWVYFSSSSSRWEKIALVIWCKTIKQYYLRGCALTSFEHDSDAVRTKVLAPRSASSTEALNYTLEGNIAIIQLIPTKLKCIIKIYPCWWTFAIKFYRFLRVWVAFPWKHMGSDL